ncbi:SDR family oxidoreductase [Novosphingobium sp. G106]|uniref:SDR family NAD(P)-dependent oxidoreductase n=1 Tax=Novosphingobium sp. G106 TaxID=2849500 RepID=UPI001C2D1CDA|nr:SDR family oxidoreductase [Novosphingobium sp. G106]MBV1689303.1 SDR family oxidoreductase [Novosphingobium sp. G106]
MAGGALTGKTAFVTGASSGIGEASARLLAEDGAAVLMMGRGEEALAAARGRIVDALPQASIETFAGDATDEGDVRAALVKAHAMAGRLDIIVPAVGGSNNYSPMLMEPTEHVFYVFKRNFLSAFLAVRDGAPLMAPDGGSIVCVSTAVVAQSSTGLVTYAAMKAGVERLVELSALELGGAKIRVNSVRPGMTRSAATAFMYDTPGTEDQYAAITPLGRTGEPEDVARAIRFLAGPEAGWITGQNFAADGGQQLGGMAPDFLDEAYGKPLMDELRAGRVPDAQRP